MKTDPFAIAVLLGAARITTPPPAPVPVLADGWQTLDWTDPARAVLDGLALLGAARAAGAALLEGVPADDVCPAETRPACSPAASALLGRMLDGDHPEFLSEWLQLAAAAGRRPAFRWLPALLDAAARDRATRELAGAVLGARGAWLARRHENWRAVLADDAPVSDASWETGTLPERVAWLRQSRATDPKRGAEALAATWAQEDGEAREAFLAIVARAPSAHDLELLEQHALKDRRREVRAHARSALLRLPDAPASKRAQAIAGPMIRLEGLLLGKRLVLTPPEAFDPAWKADGIDEKPPAGVGARAYWARQWIAAVPLSFWAARLGVDLAKLLAWNRDDESRHDILAGWLFATFVAPEADAAEALALHLLAEKTVPQGVPDPASLFRRFIAALAPDAAARVFDAMRDSPLRHFYFDLLLRSEFALPEAFARRVLAEAIAALTAKPYPQLQANHARELARRLPLALATDAIRQLAALPELSGPAEELARSLEFRLNLHRAFAAST